MNLSFSGSAKEEICQLAPHKKCCAIAEAFGVLLFCNTFSMDEIKIVTESREFALLLPKLFWKAFNVEFDEFPSMEAPGKLMFRIFTPEKMEQILQAFGFDPHSTLALYVNLSVLEEECCRGSFLRGAFLAGGSVTDPAKRYHMDITTGHLAVARETYTLMHEMLGFYPKIAERGGSQVLYLKQSDLISDFLAFLGAPVASMGIIEAKLEKDLNNKVNRRCNCDDANISKVVEAAQEQIGAIKILRERGTLETLPAKLQQAADAREKNPLSSLTELAAMMVPPITKPAMNHRLKKLMQLAKEV